MADEKSKILVLVEGQKTDYKLMEHGSQKVCPLCDIFADIGIFLVHRSLGGNKGDDTAGTYLIQCAGKEIIMDEKIVLVIPAVGHLELPTTRKTHPPA